MRPALAPRRVLGSALVGMAGHRRPAGRAVQDRRADEDGLSSRRDRRSVAAPFSGQSAARGSTRRRRGRVRPESLSPRRRRSSTLFFISTQVQCMGVGGASANPLVNTTCLDAGNIWYEKGHVHTDGCCLCDSNCDHSKETAAAGTCNYADTSAGSCKNAVTGKVTCDVVASQCASPNVWSAAGALDSDGCCFCDETCDHAAETRTDCHLKGYEDPSQSDGSCYDFTTHIVQCDISHAACDAQSRYYYSPGYINSGSGCCHCDASCDHTLETPKVMTPIPGYNCDASIAGDCDAIDYVTNGCQMYYTDLSKVDEHGTEYTFAPTGKPVAIDAAAATTVGVLAAGAAALL